MSDWNSGQYIKFEKERTQPSVDLINRIDFTPKSILDIGCGPGNSTQQLYKRFSAANILGIDSSDNMLKKAEYDYPNIKFKKCCVPDGLDSLDNYDLIFSNACLQWIPNHDILLPELMSKVNKNGALAVQIPMIQNALFYKLIDELLKDKRWESLRNVRNFHNLSPDKTYDVLSKVSNKITMWETSYYHVMQSYEKIIDWYNGSGLRPYLEKLNETDKIDFISQLTQKIKLNFKIQSDNKIILKMPRLFFIAEK